MPIVEPTRSGCSRLGCRGPRPSADPAEEVVLGNRGTGRVANSDVVLLGEDGSERVSGEPREEGLLNLTGVELQGRALAVDKPSDVHGRRDATLELLHPLNR